MSVGISLIFSIITLTIRHARIDQEQYFYSVDIHVNSTCPSKRDFNQTFIFQSINNQTKRCFSSSKNFTCDHLIYGVHYTIDGFLLCGTKNVSLSTKTNLFELAKPKYVNSSSTSKSIDTLFVLPGLFNRLIVELTTVNQTCSIEYSSSQSPFYHCLFENLPVAQWFVLTYYSLTNNDQIPSGNMTIVYTELEDLNLSCQLNRNNQQIDFSWRNFSGLGYNNLTISLLNEENKLLEYIFCDPYLFQEICSTKPFRLESGKEYHIIAKLNKNFPNTNGQKIEKCSIKTNLSEIPISSIRHEFVNETNVHVIWLEQPFSIDIRLKNLETNIYEYPIESNRTSALFIHLTQASIYQVEFNISKRNYSSILQIPNYFIQTNLKTIQIANIVRLSDSILIINLNEYDFSKIQINYCIEQLIDQSLKICSTSNIFNQLESGSIYNLSVQIQREPFEKKFFWTKQTIYKLVNTNLPPLRIQPWKTNEYCGVDLVDRYSLRYSIECSSNGVIFDCHRLSCGCRYLFKIKFNQTNIQTLCSQTSTNCDIQFNDPNLTTTLFQTPLETVENLRIVSILPLLKEIHVDFDRPSGCFDRLVLVCEILSLKQRKIFSNSTICTDLIPNEFYRIYVETKRTGWDTVTSKAIQTQLSLLETSNSNNNKRSRNLSIIIGCIIGLLLIVSVIALSTFLFVYRSRQRKKSTQTTNQQTIMTINNTTTTTKMNHILNQVNIYSYARKTHATDLNKESLISKPIRIQDLPFEYEKLIANNYFKISEEFNQLQNSLERIPKFTEGDQLFKNRYSDITPYEHSRVKLIPTDECDSGYINANFITGLNNPREYIACQGPLKTTINDHWRMIWEQNVQIIVMLTGLNERGMTKCERYWPTEMNQAEMYGNLSVCVTACVNVKTYDLRYIQIKKNDETRPIKHYAFKMWDDHTVPSQSDNLINFIRLIRSECRFEQHAPLLIHCSAGVGRSGTFIALDRLLQQFDNSTFQNQLDIYGTILDMRKCRDKMVQNEHQYLFIYRCLKEEFERSGGNSNYAIVADDVV